MQCSVRLTTTCMRDCRRRREHDFISIFIRHTDLTKHDSKFEKFNFVRRLNCAHTSHNHRANLVDFSLFSLLLNSFCFLIGEFALP
jgi:hypothetical protein